MAWLLPAVRADFPRDHTAEEGGAKGDLFESKLGFVAKEAEIRIPMDSGGRPAPAIHRCVTVANAVVLADLRQDDGAAAAPRFRSVLKKGPRRRMPWSASGAMESQG
jgi:hypothetical protein